MTKVKYLAGKTKKTSVSLSPYYQEIINREMQTGKYNSITQLVSYGLLLVEKESLLLKKAKKKSKVEVL
jgi:Arc/MetJ-type ribon-helix-helix transcriptional regulator